MNIKEKRFILLLLVIILILSGILIFKITTTPKYNQKLYDQIYSEYEEIKTKADNASDTIINSNSTTNSIHMISNTSGQKYQVAGEITIPKLKINYPIVYETSDEYLKIAPAKLYGPEVNSVGNLCIVGHNYKNNQFFSKLSQLEINDKVYLKSNTGKQLQYLVYAKYEVSETDLSCTEQNTNGKIEATLITCTSKKKNRLVVKIRAIT